MKFTEKIAPSTRGMVTQCDARKLAEHRQAELDVLLTLVRVAEGIKIAAYQLAYPGLRPDEIPYQGSGDVIYPEDRSIEALRQLLSTLSRS